MFYVYIGDSASIEDCIKMYSDSYRSGDINHPSVAKEISKIQSGESYQRHTVNPITHQNALRLSCQSQNVVVLTLRKYKIQNKIFQPET